MTDQIPTLHTPRLILRPIELADAVAIQAVFPQWEIVKYLSNLVPWPYPADGALRHLQDLVLPSMQKGTQWNWSIRRIEAPDELIGTIGLMASPGNNRGFWLSPQWQGKGLMSEASFAVTDYWFGVLNKPVMQVPKARDNTASRRISERQGMRVVAEDVRDHVAGKLVSEVWEITREEWDAQKIKQKNCNPRSQPV
jgi:ribosomal-protein-alanine N-acetyltransferase